MPDEFSGSGEFRQEPSWRSVADLAERQWGVVSSRQLRELGIGSTWADHWLRQARLRPLHRGVYSVGHDRLRQEGIWLAAVLACGRGAVLSHTSAAALWGLRSAGAQKVDVTVPKVRRQRAGVRVHESRGLARQDVTERHGVPVTSIARTLLDLAAVVPAGLLEDTVARALQRPGFDAAHIADIVARGRGHQGVGRLAALMVSEPRHTNRELERRFLALVRQASLPEPETNVAMTFGGGEDWRIDVLWRRERVSVELDSWRFHGDRQSFERDRARAATLTAAGYRHLQFTWRQVTQEPARVVRTLAAALTGS